MADLLRASERIEPQVKVTHAIRNGDRSVLHYVPWLSREELLRKLWLNAQAVFQSEHVAVRGGRYSSHRAANAQQREITRMQDGLRTTTVQIDICVIRKGSPMTEIV